MGQNGRPRTDLEFGVWKTNVLNTIGTGCKAIRLTISENQGIWGVRAIGHRMEPAQSVTPDAPRMGMNVARHQVDPTAS